MKPTEVRYGNPLLVELASVRRSLWNVKASHPRLVQMEMTAHHFACKEYNIDMLKHLIELENQTRFSWSSFQSQPELTLQVRASMFEFVMCCHTKLGLSSSTLFLSYNIIDRYCSKIIVKLPTCQLLGLTALWIASKFADKKQVIPSLQNLCRYKYNKQQFKEMELHILMSLNWSACLAPSHDSFVEILLKTKIGKLDFLGLNINDLKYGATALCELSCFNPKLNYNYNSSAIALASVTLITCALRLENTGLFEHHSSCTDDRNLIAICDQLLEQLEREDLLPLNFSMKYFTKIGDLNTNPIIRCLFVYSKKILQQERLNRDIYGVLRPQNIFCLDSSTSIDIAADPNKCRGSTSLANFPPCTAISTIVSSTKPFIPLTPTTPNGTLTSCTKQPPTAALHYPSSTEIKDAIYQCKPNLTSQIFNI